MSELPNGSHMLLHFTSVLSGQGYCTVVGPILSVWDTRSSQAGEDGNYEAASREKADTATAGAGVVASSSSSQNKLSGTPGS